MDYVYEKYYAKDENDYISMTKNGYVNIEFDITTSLLDTIEKEKDNDDSIYHRYNELALKNMYGKEKYNEARKYLEDHKKDDDWYKIMHFIYSEADLFDESEFEIKQDEDFSNKFHIDYNHKSESYYILGKYFYSKSLRYTNTKHILYVQNKYLKKAIELFKKASLLFNTEAMKKLSEIYQESNGIYHSSLLSFYWLKKAALALDVDACFELAIRYKDGNGTVKCLKKSKHWLNVAAKIDNKDESNFEIKVQNSSYEEAMRLFHSAAKRDSNSFSSAKIHLGKCYELGIGTIYNPVLGAIWYKEAASDQDRKAYYEVGKCYELGIGFSESKKTAISYYEKAVDSDDRMLCYHLGRCYEEMIYISRKKVAELYYKAAVGGCVEAMSSLGNCYRDGIGTLASSERMIYWYKKGAKQDDVYAQCNLAHCFENGEGVKKSKYLATYWNKKALKNNRKVAKSEIEKLLKNSI